MTSPCTSGDSSYELVFSECPEDCGTGGDGDTADSAKTAPLPPCPEVELSSPGGACSESSLSGPLGLVLRTPAPAMDPAAVLCEQLVAQIEESSPEVSSDLRDDVQPLSIVGLDSGEQPSSPLPVAETVEAAKSPQADSPSTLLQARSASPRLRQLLVLHFVPGCTRVAIFEHDMLLVKNSKFCRTSRRS